MNGSKSNGACNKNNVTKEIIEAFRCYLREISNMSTNHLLDFLVNISKPSPTTESKVLMAIAEGLRTGMLNEVGGSLFFVEDIHLGNSTIKSGILKRSANITPPINRNRLVNKPVKRLTNTSSRRSKNTTTRRNAVAREKQRSNNRTKQNSKSQCNKNSTPELTKRGGNDKASKKQNSKSQCNKNSTPELAERGGTDKASKKGKHGRKSKSPSISRSSSEGSGWSSDRSSISTDDSDKESRNRAIKDLTTQRQSRSLRSRSRKGKSRKNITGKRQPVGSRQSRSISTGRSSFRSRTPTRRGSNRTGNQSTPKRVLCGNEAKGVGKTGKLNNSKTKKDDNPNKCVSSTNNLNYPVVFTPEPHSTDNRVVSEEITETTDEEENSNGIVPSKLKTDEKEKKPSVD